MVQGDVACQNAFYAVIYQSGQGETNNLGLGEREIAELSTGPAGPGRPTGHKY